MQISVHQDHKQSATIFIYMLTPTISELAPL